MNLCNQLEDESGGLAETSLSEQYPIVLEEYKAKKGLISPRHSTAFYAGIWNAKIARGNIYRYLGISLMHRHISHDLWCQLEELADKYAHIFEQYTSNRTERAEVLFSELHKTKVENSPEKLLPGEEPLYGYLPLEEFLESRVDVKANLPWPWGLWLVPHDEQKASENYMTISLAFVVLTVQILAPLCMVINGLVSDTNWLKHPSVAWKALTFSQATCLGRDTVGVSLTLIGTLLLYVVIFIIRAELRRELEDADKAGRALNSTFWYIMATTSGNFACTMLILALPFVFWSERKVVNMVCDSMGVLFLYSLDDLAEVVFNYLGMSEENYQQRVWWTNVFLTKCPLYLSDLVDPAAKSLDEFWRIGFDDQGYLLSTGGGRCETRLEDAHLHFTDLIGTISETLPLLSNKKAPGTLLYKNRGYQRYLPSYQNRIGFAVSYYLSVVFAILQVLLPAIFFVFNDPCDSRLLVNKAQSLSFSQVSAAVWNVHGMAGQ